MTESEQQAVHALMEMLFEGKIGQKDVFRAILEMAALPNTSVQSKIEMMKYISRTYCTEQMLNDLIEDADLCELAYAASQDIGDRYIPNVGQGYA